jgi:hypothetical protein
MWVTVNQIREQLGGMSPGQLALLIRSIAYDGSVTGYADDVIGPAKEGNDRNVESRRRMVGRRGAECLARG